MKFEVDKNKLGKVLGDLLRILPVALILITTVIFLVLTYLAIFPQEDLVAEEAGSARVKSLDIRFDSKLLGELSNTSSPSTVGESGGRDPFSPF